jgi:hypothetical protein
MMKLYSEDLRERALAKRLCRQKCALDCGSASDQPVPHLEMEGAEIEKRQPVAGQDGRQKKRVLAGGNPRVAARAHEAGPFYGPVVREAEASYFRDQSPVTPEAIVRISGRRPARRPP